MNFLFYSILTHRFLLRFLAYGFAGLAFSVLDILLLRADNIIGLFQVTGISEWATYLGVTQYKCATSFVPFFILLVILGVALKSVLFGNAGRWLATILTMFLYAFSNTPMGLLIAKRFVKSNFRGVANWYVVMSVLVAPIIPRAHPVISSSDPKAFKGSV